VHEIASKLNSAVARDSYLHGIEAHDTLLRLGQELGVDSAM